jgi:hypothetical protein
MVTHLHHLTGNILSQLLAFGKTLFDDFLREWAL